MGEEACRDCRSWEEEIYWTHFQCLHFSQVLRPSFRRQLPIPEHFTKNLRKKLPQVMTLRGPSGLTWQVVLTTNDDTMFFNHGWEEFVNDHFLQEKDLLIFKYNGDSCFDVLIFDGQSLCEKAGSYFVRKCGHREHDSGYHTKRKTGENSFEAPLPCPEDVVGFSPPQKSANNDIDTTPLGRPNIYRCTTKKTRREIEFTNPIHEEFSTSDEEIETKPDMEHVSPSVVHSVPYLSSRRLITEEEKQNVCQLAQAVLTRDGFMVVMKPTHVYRRFYMSIPSAWTSKNLRSLEKQDVILRTKENTWHTKFYYQKSKNSGGLSSGWKSFALANDLQEFDVCVFEPGSPVNDAIVLDVNIFRVFPED
ncbi:hypothetical protein P3X46_020948 [Hevea brasiliensis]|nr:B3 domain-containing protein REM16 isoform X2 [Hevea brasiliensis]XP_021683402.2 B3 domain-containing protein REM16 isoform X2 [Hevea brasiliensis]XP_021683403.2 B3 domain-containing protein REM16 isoform X2 [Hevea brasiliensis]XP_021683404.2 B3 domain-containing protein REM16 isoform X2 [Hevea brasiliensis]KAJ9166163.1 hypothetical protein P3X46_020948 [Hevea brasiliensis]